MNDVWRRLAAGLIDLFVSSVFFYMVGLFVFLAVFQDPVVVSMVSQSDLSEGIGQEVFSLALFLLHVWVLQGVSLLWKGKTIGQHWVGLKTEGSRWNRIIWSLVVIGSCGFLFMVSVLVWREVRYDEKFGVKVR